MKIKNPFPMAALLVAQALSLSPSPQAVSTGGAVARMAPMPARNGGNLAMPITAARVSGSILNYLMAGGGGGTSQIKPFYLGVPKYPNRKSYRGHKRR